jgi:hypothetical protein
VQCLWFSVRPASAAAPIIPQPGRLATLRRSGASGLSPTPSCPSGARPLTSTPPAEPAMASGIALSIGRPCGTRHRRSARKGFEFKAISKHPIKIGACAIEPLARIHISLPTRSRKNAVPPLRSASRRLLRKPQGGRAGAPARRPEMRSARAQFPLGILQDKTHHPNG